MNGRDLMAKYFMLFVLVMGAFVAMLVIYMIMLGPVHIADLSAQSAMRIEAVDTSVVDKSIVLKNRFEPFLASPAAMIASMLAVGEEAKDVVYRAYLRRNNMDLAIIEIRGNTYIVQVGDEVAGYVIFGITDLAVLLNETETNIFKVVKQYAAGN